MTFVYAFEEGNRHMKKLIGGKGANLAEMTNIGLPVPEGFTISTEACLDYYNNGETLSDQVKQETFAALKALEKKTGKELGGKEDPLFVSIRSGAVASMPGMMDTVLNLGMNDETVEAMASLTDNPRFSYDSYRRFIQMFSDVVLGVETYFFERELEKYREKKGYTSDPEMTAADWQELIQTYKQLVDTHTGRPFPIDPHEQLLLSVEAVFDSWNNDRAAIYRKLHQIPHDLGTAVNIQSMVFGNMGDDSGTGVAFTRNPSTGEALLYGEYLVNAQGEDVVAGIRTPQPISTMKDVMPEVFEEFQAVCNRLEAHYEDMQDIEFTVERGKLYVLQTRNGKRTSQASVQIAVDMVEEGVLTKEQAVDRVDPEQLHQLLHRRIDDGYDRQPLVKGLPASPGAATGRIVFDADEADRRHKDGERVILIRPETTPDDIHGIIAAEAVVTSRGGMTSHAAVVARGMGKACICGCEGMKINLQDKTIQIQERKLGHLDLITIDGSTGEVFEGDVPMVEPELSGEFQLLLNWADDVRRLGVRANADNPADAAKAVEFGAEGIGLCRTEHMFMEQERVPVVRSMILSETASERDEALRQLLPMQQEDFEGIFKAMAGRPVTIRLLDPPLHEFLPDLEELLIETTKLEVTGENLELLQQKQRLLRKLRELHEFNPMLGHRGCRLGMTNPEIYDMQAEAVFRAAAALEQNGMNVEPEIMIPLVGHVNELRDMRRVVEEAAARVTDDTGVRFTYTIGTMIEVPRAALTADHIAAEADFFSFGTNDLTQTTFGYSRDDAEGKFLQRYVDNGTLDTNPFVTLDRDGVGRLVQEGVTLGRQAKPDLKTGICGEHGGEPASIAFCEEQGLDYVSCSPFRVPVARLAAAQAAIRAGKKASSAAVSG
ncbi:pyruvate, phosphate dikinase [Alkalicoccus luteus]|uniref:Pyruvate, phosphate dikinase n=1 Tax=Alkalicoccus luteus TaxID=1237094 RepID=A0A969PPP3_9BACI|nr:pyruvate, phosphate dikinase [Alkalicoccus luteus]NJP38105.1 pyruvate, phosphate dikinase [Alkalicoccus luteus]